MEKAPSYDHCVSVPISCLLTVVQPGEGPSKGLLHDCETDGSFEALVIVPHDPHRHSVY